MSFSGDIIQRIDCYASNYWLNNTRVAIDVDYELQDDGNGAYIKNWFNTEIARPTTQQLASWCDNCERGICPLNVAKKEKLEQNLEGYLSIREGTKTIDSVPINIDPTSCINITGKALQITVNQLQQGTPLTITWYDNNNVGHQYTEAEFIQLGETVAGTIEAIQFKLSDNIVAINSATSMNELDAIDIDYSVFA